MSTIAAWSYTEGPATVWPYTLDQYSQPQYGTPILIPATDYINGGEVSRDAEGNEFVPKLTVYFEGAADAAYIPKREWYIKPGDHTALATPPKDAERVRTVTQWPMTKFGAGELPDWRVEA
jgi:hypothetical protein